jgi:hypothetical protein
VKHLRKFNEGKEPDESEIYDLSKDYLAYLLDDDYSCDVQTGYEWSHTKEKLTSKLATRIILQRYKNNSSKNEKLLWNNVKDHFIAFIHLLSKDYDIDYFEFIWIGLQVDAVPVLRSTKRSLQQVLDDDNCDFEPLEKIIAIISKKE